jgi:hypothetical protein
VTVAAVAGRAGSYGTTRSTESPSPSLVSIGATERVDIVARTSIVEVTE